MDALKRAAGSALLALLAGAAEAQTVSSLTDATLPLTGQEYLYIVQNGQPRRVHPAALAPAGIVIPTAQILGGAANAFVVVSVGENLDLTGNVLSAPVPTAELLGGDANALTPIVVGSELAIEADTLNLTVTGVTPGDYTNTNLTVDEFGRLTAAASGVGECASVAAGAVLFSDGVTCAGNQPKFGWDNTNFRLSIVALPGVLLNEGFGFDLIGGNSSAGGAARIRQSVGGGSMRLGFNDTGATPYAHIDSRNALDTIAPLSLNNGGANVMIGAVPGDFIGQPQAGALGIESNGVNRWYAALGTSGAFRGGLYNNAASDAELRLFDDLGAETARISADSAGTSVVPNRFTAPGLTDTSLVSCVVTADGSGNLQCGSAGVGVPGGATHSVQTNAGGAAFAGVGPLTNGQLVVGNTGSAPNAATLTAGAGISIVNGAGTITVAATGGASGGYGLYQPVITAPPTTASTGLSAWVNQGTATITDAASGSRITVPVSAGYNWRARTKAAPATPYTITALVALDAPNTNYAYTGIGWTDGTKFQSINHSYEGFFGLSVESWANITTYTSTQKLFPTAAVPLWVQISDDGTNVFFRWSMTGENFVTAYTIDKASGYLGAGGYSTVFFGVNAANSVISSGTLLSWLQN